MSPEYYRHPSSLKLRVSSAELGAGYRSLDLSAMANPFVRPAVERTPMAEGLEWESFYAESHYDLQKTLDVEASASGHYGGASADAAAAVSDKIGISRSSVVVGVRARTTSATMQMPAEPKLSAMAARYLLDDPMSFYELYGDMYVRGLWFGPELVLMASMHADTQTRRMQLSTEFTGSYGGSGCGVTASAASKSTLSEALSRESAVAKVYMSGESTALTQALLDPRQMIKGATEYLAQDHTNSLQWVVLAPYETLDVPPDQHRAFEKLAKLLGRARQQRETIVGGLIAVDRAQLLVPADDYLAPDVYLPRAGTAGARREAWLAGLRAELESAQRANVAEPTRYRLPARLKTVERMVGDELAARRVLQDSAAGGSGGAPFSDDVRDLERISDVAVYATEKNGEPILGIGTTAVLHGGQTRIIEHFGSIRGYKGTRLAVLSIPEDAYLSRITLLHDDLYPRQITLEWRHLDGREGTPLVWPPELSKTWRDAHEKQLSSTASPDGSIICGFHGRAGSWVDRIGVFHVPVPVMPGTPAAAAPKRTTAPRTAATGREPAGART